MSTINEKSHSPASLKADGSRAGEDITDEALVRRVTELVIRELRGGMRPGPADGSEDRRNQPAWADSGPSGIHVERVDMSGYKTPVLTERHVRCLRPLTAAVVVPAGTVVSQKARELLRDRNIQLCIE